MIYRRARAHRRIFHKSTMGMCRNKFWMIVLSIFSIWSVLICLNYSSLIDSVATLAKFYVYSVNYQQSISLASNPINISYTTQEENTTTTRNSKKNEQKIEKTEEKEGEIVDEEIDSLINVNIDDDLVQKNDSFLEEKTQDPSIQNSTQDQPLKESTLLKEIPQENQQKNPSPKKKRRKGRSKRRKPKNFPIIQQVDPNVGEINSNTSPPPPPLPPSPPPPPPRKCQTELKTESCTNRYIYVHTLPRRFNVDLLRDCKSLDLWMDMCQYVRNSGLGPELPNTGRVFSEYGWFGTNQFVLEVIFHNRMKQYECLTNDSSQASAIFVPFYAGLDVARHLWNTDPNVRDSGGFELAKWLRRKPEWKKWWGRDHFFVGGRITWDFRRSANKKDPDWGTKFLYLPETKNMTGLVIESSPWNNNDFGIPYPTYFHPANDYEVVQWQDKMRKMKRRNLFSFAGAPRPDRPDSIRNQLISQCNRSKKCMLVHCNNWKNKCHSPIELMRVFQSSVFCLQPPGDSYTRRSTFDSILAGCIPVFFHPGSAYVQYLWHFPREFTKYSVFISMYDVRDGDISIQRTLEMISQEKVNEMREEVINLIPKIIYADPRCRLETIEDAFDVAIKGVLERVKMIKEDMKNGRKDSFDYDETQAWKYRWLGKLEEHEWDPYFSGSFDSRNFTNF